MGGDGGDAAFEGQGKDARVGVFGPNDRQGMFAARVSQEGQFSFGHAFPELGEAAVIAIDVVAVGKDFHYGRSASKAPVEFFKGIRDVSSQDSAHTRSGHSGSRRFSFSGPGHRKLRPERE